jgi:hypothetical protein
MRRWLSALLVLIPTLAFAGDTAFIPSGANSNAVKATEGTYTVGKAFYASSTTGGASNTNACTTPELPCATLTGANSKAVSGRGDIIYLMSGHAETLTGTITLDKANVNIIGLGHDDRMPFSGSVIDTQRPQFTADTTTDKIQVTAESVSIQNVVFYTNVAAHVVWIENDADYLTLDRVQFTARNASNIRTIDLIDTKEGQGVTGLTLKNSYITAHCTGTDGESVIEGDGNNNILIENNYVRGCFTAGIFDFNSAYGQATIRIIGNTLMQIQNATLVWDVTGGTGEASFNRGQASNAACATGISAGFAHGSLILTENYFTCNGGAGAILVGTPSS